MNAFVNHANLAFRLQYEQVTTRYDSDYKVAWTFMNPTGRPCFNPQLLSEMINFHTSIKQFKGQYYENGGLKKISYHVLASAIPGVFNLGGDLQTFHDKIIEGNREALKLYADLCIDSVWHGISHFDSSITTISLVQGQALGGGFEAALTSDLIVAERSAKLGLPEILFNLFPGMGALSLISRKIGIQKAEEIILSGKLYSAEELYELGLIDILAEDGSGEERMYEWIEKNARQRNGYIAVQRSKNVINPISREELDSITSIWVDAALSLEPRDLRMMKRLIQAQSKVN